MAFGLIRINRQRTYTEQELREIADFNHRLVERVLPEIREFMAVFETKPQNVVVFKLPSNMVEAYNDLLRRYC
jgi:hypothetical protein